MSLIHTCHAHDPNIISARSGWFSHVYKYKLLSRINFHWHASILGEVVLDKRPFQPILG